MQRSQVKEALKFARKRGMFTAEEAARHGIHSQILTRLVRDGDRLKSVFSFLFQ